MFRKMPFLLLASLLMVLFLAPFMSLEVKAFLYGLSLSIKSIIIFLLPLIIFGLLFKVSASLIQKGTKVIVLMFGGICISNFISTMVSYSIGSGISHFDLSLGLPQSFHELSPAWTLSLPKLIDNDVAMLSGLVLGVLVSLARPDVAGRMSVVIEKGVAKVLSFFTFLIPLFISGFVVKLYDEGAIVSIVQDYSFIFAVIALSQFTYIFLIYCLGNQFRAVKVLRSIKNMLPAAIAGFTTMSSAAAMPLTILGTEKNAEHPDLVKSLIPATVNVHLIGDCLAIPIFAFAILKNYGMADPSFATYLVFAVYFVIAKFSVAAVPGGGILVMLPILESNLSFNGEMLSLITALYILFDPVITSANVLGNGGFALLLGKIYGKVESSKAEVDFSQETKVN